MYFIFIHLNIFLCSDKWNNTLGESEADEILAGSHFHEVKKVVEDIPWEFKPIISSSPTCADKLEKNDELFRNSDQNNNFEISQVSRLENVRRRRRRSPFIEDFIPKRVKTYLASTHLEGSSISGSRDIDISSITANESKSDKEETFSIKNKKNKIELKKSDNSVNSSKEKLHARAGNKKSRRSSLNRQMGSSNIISKIDSVCVPNQSRDTNKGKANRAFGTLKKNMSYVILKKKIEEKQSSRRKSENFTSILGKLNIFPKNKKKT